MPGAIPFTLRVPDEVLEDLRARLARVRWPDEPPLEPWSTGTSVAYLKALVEYWRTGFDWRAQEARLNGFRQFKVPLAGIELHFIHEEGKGPDPIPLLLSHGWPGSVVEFLRLIPMLTDPASHGGDARDAFTVVAPSLPGYTLSFTPGQPRFGVEAIADLLVELMTGVLGYERFGAQGGDWGSFVTSRLAYVHAERMIGIHLNLLPVRRDPQMLANPTAEEKRYLAELTAFLKEETGYQWIQGTRPQTLAFATHRLAGRARGLAGREVPRLERLRWRSRERDQPRRDAHKHHALLGDRRDRLVVLAVLCPDARAMADSRGSDRGPDRLRPVSEGDPATAALGRRARLQRHPAVDGEHEGRALRRPRAADSARARDPRVLPAAPRVGTIRRSPGAVRGFLRRRPPNPARQRRLASP